MDFSIFLYVAVLLLVALLSTRLMKIVKLPNVTGYIITGIIMGPFIFGLFFNNFSFSTAKSGIVYQFVQSLSWVSTIALGFIAFTIGTSFKVSTLKAVGKRVLIITIFESLFASLFVIGALIVAHFLFPQYISIELALCLGAIAAATAPAATLMVIKQYRAKGSLVDTLLPVVALDDAVALILFAVLFQVASSISGGGFDLYKMIFKPIIEILISLVIGAGLGFVISYMNRFFKSRNNRLAICIFSVFASVGLYYLFKNKQLGGFELSYLLTCMMVGSVYTNMSKESGPTLDVLERFTSPIYMMFFVISGATLDLTIFGGESGVVVLLLALIYVVFRVAGKYSGAYLACSLTHSEDKVKKYLGFTLVPQAGVAIGLATTASTLFGANEETAHIGALIIAVILTSTLVYELFGPMISKWALKKAGDIEENA